MSTSETDSEPEPELAIGSVSSLTAFAHLSAIRPSQGLTDQETVSWAVDTLLTLDFRLVCQDTALHGLIQNCASKILALFSSVFELEPTIDDAFDFIPEVVSILRPSFLRLLFQYRRLFRVIAVRDIDPNSAPLAVVCWVDVVLAKLSDVVAFIAAGLDRDVLYQSLPESLKAQREESNLRAAIQLPDNWDMLPSMLLSERVSIAAKRLSTRLMLGRYILYPALSGQADVDDTIHKLLSPFAEFVRQSAARVDELRSASGPGLQYPVQQERLTGAMVVSLFAAADMAQNPIPCTKRTAAFRPQTMAAAMQLLQFVLNEGRYLTQMDILSPSDRLDVPSSIVIRWGTVPQWAWGIWLEYRSLYADTIIHLTTMYFQHHSACLGLNVSDLMSTNNRLGNQAVVIGVMIDLVFRFISVLSAGERSMQLPTRMMSVLHGCCQLISQWMNQNLCGIQNSKECCIALIVLFGHLSQSVRHLVLSDLVIECLVRMTGQCTREAWGVTAENFRIREVLHQSFMQAKTALSQSDLPEATEIHAAQLMQFLVVMMSKRVQPFNPDAYIEFIDAVWGRVLEMPRNSPEFLCETLLICLAAAKMSETALPTSKITVAVDEVVWHLGMCSKDVNLFLASAFSSYITSGPVNVEALAYLEGLEYLLNTMLLICSRHCSRSDEPLALMVLPTICNALAHLLEHRDDTTGKHQSIWKVTLQSGPLGVYTFVDMRISALASVLKSLSSGEHSGDEYGKLLTSRLPRTARRMLEEMYLGRPTLVMADEAAYELVLWRVESRSHLMYVRAV